MSKLLLITGGARSGKSEFAANYARETGTKVAFIATGGPGDEEMKKRIERHRKDRPATWGTFEEPLALARVFNKISDSHDTAIIDCLTLFLSNCMLKGMGEEDIEKELTLLLKAIAESKTCTIIVTNEVGMGIVPHTGLGREFRDIAGRINRITAEKADEVYLLVSGIPLKLKG